MTIESSWLQNRTYSARKDRALIAGLYDEGVIDLLSLAVTESSPAAMTVAVSAGSFVIDGDDQTSPPQNSYFGQSTAVETSASVVAPVTDPRIDLIVMQVRDLDATGPAGDDTILVIVTGTEAASPVAPDVPDSAIPLAQIALTVGQTSIIDANITNRRTIAGPKAPAGTMNLYSGSSAQTPSGWLIANGATPLRADYPALHALYAAQGYPFGSGNGTTTFGIPNMLDRVPVAAGAVKATVGASGGTVNHTITEAELPAHVHTLSNHAHTLSAHTHTLTGTAASGGGHGHSDSFVNVSVSSHMHTGLFSTSGYTTEQFRGNPGSFGSASQRMSTEDPGFATSGRYRTGADGAHNHTLSGSVTAVSGHVHSVAGSTVGPNTPNTGPAAGNTSSVGDGTAISVEQPFLVLNAWLVRT
jgi:microcystin-dependent protein